MSDDCGRFELTCHVRGAFNSAIDDLGDAIFEATGDIVMGMGTMWTNVNTLDPTEGEVHDADPFRAPGVETVLSYMQWIGWSVAVLALIFLGALIAVRMRAGEGIVAVGRMGIVLGGVVLISGSAALVGTLRDSIWDARQMSGGTASFLQVELFWFTMAAAMLGVLIGATKMIWEQRAEPGKDIVKQLLTLVVVAVLGTTVMSLLITAADDFADHLLGQPDSGDFAESVMDMLFLVGVGTGSPGFAVMLVIILGLCAIVMSLVQIILMVARSAMLILLAGILPTTAAFTNTPMGKQWFAKSIGWTIAFILYKPVAAIIYAAAFDLAGSGGSLFSDSSDDTDFVGMMAGFMMMLLALFALPALLRFVSPAMAAMSGAAGGAAMGAAAAALPTGAQAIGRLGGGGDKGDPGPSGSSGNSGSSGDQGASGNSGNSGSSGDQGASGSSGSGGGSGPSGGPGPGGGAGPGQAAGAGASSGGGAASGAAGAGAGAGGGGAAAGAGAAAGPVGAAAGAAMQAGQKGADAAKATANEAADNSESGGEQPSGSHQ